MRDTTIGTSVPAIFIGPLRYDVDDEIFTPVLRLVRS